MCMRWHRASNVRSSVYYRFWHRARYLICSAARARACQAGGSWQTPTRLRCRGRHHEGRKLQRGDGLQRRRGQLPPKLYAEILSNYTVLHHNLKYTWLDPKDDDVVKDYEALYGPDDDAGSDSDSSSRRRHRGPWGEEEGEADAPWPNKL